MFLFRCSKILASLSNSSSSGDDRWLAEILANALGRWLKLKVVAVARSALLWILKLICVLPRGFKFLFKFDTPRTLIERRRCSQNNTFNWLYFCVQAVKLFWIRNRWWRVDGGRRYVVILRMDDEIRATVRFNLDFLNLNQLKLKKWNNIFEPKGGRMYEVRKK